MTRWVLAGLLVMGMGQTRPAVVEVPRDVPGLLAKLANDPDARVRGACALGLVSSAEKPEVVAGLTAAYERDLVIRPQVLLALAQVAPGKVERPALELLRQSRSRDDHDLALYCNGATDKNSAPLFAMRDVLHNLPSPYDQFLSNELDFVLLTTWRPPVDPRPRTYTDDPRDLHLAVRLDDATYRPNEPIRVETCLWNDSPEWASVVKVSPIAAATLDGVAFEIRDAATGKVMQMGPVPMDPQVRGEFEWHGGAFLTEETTLAPHEFWRLSGCLQKWIGPLALPPGQYVLDTWYRPPLANHGAHAIFSQWQAPLVHFQIAGEPITNPLEMLAAIAEKAQTPTLAEDLSSPQSDHRRFAWEMVDTFADEPTLAFLREQHPEHPRSGEARGAWPPRPLLP